MKKNWWAFYFSILLFAIYDFFKISTVIHTYIIKCQNHLIFYDNISYLLLYIFISFMNSIYYIIKSLRKIFLRSITLKLLFINNQFYIYNIDFLSITLINIILFF